MSEIEDDYEDLGDYEEEHVGYGGHDGYDEDDLVSDFEKAELDAFEISIQKDSNKIQDTIQVKPEEKVEKKEDKPVVVENLNQNTNPVPKKNKLNDLFFNSSDKTGKITKVYFIFSSIILIYDLLFRINLRNKLSSNSIINRWRNRI